MILLTCKLLLLSSCFQQGAQLLQHMYQAQPYTVRMRTATIALNYSVKNIRNDIYAGYTWKIALVCGLLTLAPIINCLKMWPAWTSSKSLNASASRILCAWVLSIVPGCVLYVCCQLSVAEYSMNIFNCFWSGCGGVLHEYCQLSLDASLSILHPAWISSTVSGCVGVPNLNMWRPAWISSTVSGWLRRRLALWIRRILHECCQMSLDASLSILHPAWISGNGSWQLHT